MKIDGYTEHQPVPKLLFQVSVREIHNNIASAKKDGGIKEARDEDDNIIISDSTLRSLLPCELKKCCQDTRLCVVVNVAYLPKVCIHHYYHCMIIIFKNSRISAKMLKTEGLGGKANCIYMTYKIQSCYMSIIFTPKTMT